MRISLLKYVLLITSVFIIIAGCNRKSSFIPKPRGYFRIDFPEKKYQLYKSNCNYSFEYPVYGEIENYKGRDAEPCWINIVFQQFNSRLHLTYKKVDHNLAAYTEDIHSIANKHIPKADDIIEKPIDYKQNRVFGMYYDIRGNTASSVNFYITDSTDNFLSGALYFNSIPNKDSLAPVISFLSADIQHLLKTFEWN